MSPATRRAAVEHVRDALGRDRVSERRACHAPGQPRSTQRRAAHVPDGEPALARRMVERATPYGRYGYRRVTARLRADGFAVSHQRVERLWRREGLNVPAEQPARRRLWLNGGSCVRRRPAHPNHVGSYDFVQCRTTDGRAFRPPTVIDAFTRECLAIDAARRITAADVRHRPCERFAGRGPPGHLRSDTGPAFTAEAVRRWLGAVGVGTLFIAPGRPWESGSVERFNGEVRDERLNPELFDTLLEAKVLTERWRRRYNTVRPHRSLGDRPPAPEARLTRPPAEPVSRSPAGEE